jgi:glutamine---fructose-6-phosphate transaminase (isomerizing)
MTHFLQDILRQPDELQRTIAYLSASGEGKRSLDAAVAAIRGARHVFLTGIGSSWHAAQNAATFFYANAHPVYVQDAAELLNYATIPPGPPGLAGSVIIIISRSGRSIEIVQLAKKVLAAGATIIAITNVADGPLAKLAQIPIVIPSPLDHAISVVTYTTLAAAAAILAASVVGKFSAPLAATLSQSIAEAGRAIPGWQRQIAESKWLLPGAVTYFLARGSSLGNAQEARLMWEEGVKSPATAMGSASFRHGPQEMIAKDYRFALWIDASAQQREKDLALARDLRKLGASVMLIGQTLPDDAGDGAGKAAKNLVFQLPSIPSEWQFLIDIIPAQLVADKLAALSGVDCDTFRLCSFVVEDDGGVLPNANPVSSKGEKS